MPQVANAGFYLLALLGFGFVIAIHEFGHFLFAKWAGVRVERFSIGFGPVLLSRRIGETEYSLSLLPLGGYVKMLGEENPAQGDTVGGSDDPRSYVNASRGWKAVILLGGVTFNLVSSWLILVGLAFWGMPMTPPVVAEIEPMVVDAGGKAVESPARRLGLQQGDQVIRVDGKIVRSFDDIPMNLAANSGEAVTLRVHRGAADVDLPAPGAAPVYPVLTGGIPALGIRGPMAPTIEAVKRLSGPAQEGDPKPGEQVVAVDGERLPLDSFGQQIEERLRRAIGRKVELTLRDKQGAERPATVLYAGTSADMAIETPVVIARVIDGTPAAAAGVKPGDVAVAVNGSAVRSPSDFLGLVSRLADGDIALTLLRAGQEVPISLRADNTFGQRKIGVVPVALDVGILPSLPKALDGGEGALAAAGLKPGEGLMRRLARRDQDEDEYLALAGVEQALVPLEEGDYLRLYERRTFGRTSIARRLFATRVAAPIAELDAVLVEDRSGIHEAVGIDRLSTPSRARLRAELRAGDWIAGDIVGPDGRQSLVVLRGATTPPRALTVVPRSDGVAMALTPYLERPHVLTSTGEAFAIANDAAYDMVANTLQLIPRFFRPTEHGGIDATKTLSGPIGIFTQFKLRAERQGFASFLKLVALIGLNLFLVNLLPIPIVDGGQLVFLGIEAVIRRPLPEKMRLAANYAGFALVLVLMAFTLGIDIWRQLGWL